MNFEKGNIYHVYNQGNNKQLIFFSKRNYEYFLRKIRLYILPYADILAWCLMPNHFHLMLYVHHTYLENAQGITEGDTQDMTENNIQGIIEGNTQGMTISHALSVKPISLNNSIGIMLRSYTRGINKERGWSGSLFRKYTKAVNLTSQDGVCPSWFKNNGITQVNVDQPEREYPQICFRYIHDNPVSHGFVYDPKKWRFSSYREYRSKNGRFLINKSRADELGLNLNYVSGIT